MVKQNKNNFLVWIILVAVVVLVMVLVSNWVNDSPNENQNTNLENTEEKISYQNYEVKLYLGDFENIQEILSQPTSLNYPADNSNYFLSDIEVENGEEFYGKEVLYLYSNYSEERILCNIEEYYDGDLNSEFQIIIGSGTPYVALGYEKNNVPSEVKYILECRGMEGGIEYNDSYTFNLIIS